MRALLVLLFAALCCADLPPPSFSFGGDEWLNASSDLLVHRVSNAELIDGGIELTSVDATSSQAGAFWYVPRVYVAAFTVTFTYQSTPNSNSDLKGLDGLAFVIQAEDWVATIGPAGGGIAYGEGELDGHGITNCVAIELDTFQDPAPISDPDGNHIAIHVSNGSAPISAREPGVALTSGVPRLNDGQLHNVTIAYKRGALTVYYGEIIGPVLINIPVDVETIVGGATAWVGFTGSIGATGGDGHLLTYFSYDYAGKLTPGNSLVTGLNKTLSISAGDNVTFTMQARDQYDNPCQADSSVPSVSIEEGTPVTASFVSQGDGLFTVSFFVTVSGTWTLDVMLDGIAVASSPVMLNIAPGPVAPAHCSAVGSGLSTAIATTVSNFTVTVKDKYDNAFLADPNLTIDFNKGPQAITPIITDGGAGVYNVAYTAAKMGAYNIAIRVNSSGSLKPIAGSPFALNVQAGPVEASHCNTSGPGLSGFAAGTPMWFAVTARDIFDNVVPETDPTIFTVTLLKGGSSIPVTLEAIADRKGTFNATFTITVTGSWTLQVTLASDGKDVMGSPFTLSITSAPDPSISLCNVTDSFNGLTGGAAGSTLTFQIIAHDMYGNLMTNEVYFSVAITSNSNASLIIPTTSEFQPPGLYIISYVPEVVGVYTIAVQYFGQSLPGSPWTALISPGPSSGLGTYTISFPGHLSEKEVGNFMIQVADKYGNNQTNNNDNFAFTVTKKGSANSTDNWPFQVISSNHSDGLYYVVFGPADKRGTFLVSVRLIAPTTEPIMGSPFTVDVSWGLSALEIAGIGMGLAVFVLLLMLGLYLYRRVVIPWRKRRRYQEILKEDRNPIAPASP